MPKKLEEKLRAEYGNNDRAVFGTMNKIEKAEKMKAGALAKPGRKVAKTGKLGKRGKL
jgi:hypothetical protein